MVCELQDSKRLSFEGLTQRVLIGDDQGAPGRPIKLFVTHVPVIQQLALNISFTVANAHEHLRLEGHCVVVFAIHSAMVNFLLRNRGANTSMRMVLLWYGIA